MSGNAPTAFAGATSSPEVGVSDRTRPLRIMHVVAPAPFGGLERVVHALVAGQSARGHQVSVAAIVAPSTPDRHPFFGLIADMGVTQDVVRVAGRAYGSERGAIRSLVARRDPDVVHTHGYRPDVLDAGVARAAGVPTVTTVHGFTGGDWKNLAYEWLQRRAFRRFDAVVAVSRPMFDDLRARGVPAGILHLLPNAWAGGEPPLERAAARAALGLPADDWRVAFIGRLSREKGADVLLDAMTYLRDLPVHVSILGDGADREELRERARTRGIADRIRWHGAVPSAGRLLGAFDLFVLSSRTEGTPIVLFEAMAARVPIVATCVGGVPDVIGSGEGSLVPPDDAEALAAEVRACFRDYPAALGRARAATERLARVFAPLPWLERYEDIYRAAINARQRSDRS